MDSPATAELALPVDERKLVKLAHVYAAIQSIALVFFLSGTAQPAAHSRPSQLGSVVQQVQRPRHHILAGPVLPRPSPHASRSTRPVHHYAQLGWDYWSPRIKSCESGGDYRATNPRSGASGAYQFLDSTWNGRYGFVHARDASREQQDAAAFDLYRHSGLTPWYSSRNCWEG